MPVAVGWDDHIIWLEFAGEWTWQEYDQAIDGACVLSGSVDCRITLVFDLLNGPDMPLSQVFSHLQRGAQILKLDSWLVIGATASVRGFLYVFSRTYPALGWTPTFVDCLEEATNFLSSWQDRRRWT